MRTLSVGILLVAVVGAACRADEDAANPAPPTPTVTATADIERSTPVPAPAFAVEPSKYVPTVAITSEPPPHYASYPAGTRTGAPELDAILSAIESKDAERIRPMLYLSSKSCEEERPVQPQPLRCPDGVSVGTPIVGWWVIDVEGGLWREPDLSRNLANFFSTGLRLYAVYSVGADSLRPPDDGGGETVVVFVRTAQSVEADGHLEPFDRIQCFAVHRGLITMAYTLCLYPPDQRPPYDFGAWVLPPPD